MTTDVGEPALPRPATADRILDAVEDALSKNGIRATSMADIARAAGVTRMTVYRYYGSREALLRAFIEREMGFYYTNVIARAQKLASGLRNGENEARVVLGEIFEYSLSKFLHKPIVAALIENDPDITLPAITTNADFVLTGVVKAQRVYFDQWRERGLIAPIPSDWISDWAGRLLLSWRFQTSPVFDTSDPSTARQLFDTFIWPVLDPERQPAGGD